MKPRSWIGLNGISLCFNDLLDPQMKWSYSHHICNDWWKFLYSDNWPKCATIIIAHNSVFNHSSTIRLYESIDLNFDMFLLKKVKFEESIWNETSIQTTLAQLCAHCSTISISIPNYHGKSRFPQRNSSQSFLLVVATFEPSQHRSCIYMSMGLGLVSFTLNVTCVK